MKQVLVVYFSCGGVTKRIAEYMQSAGADLYRIEAKIPYTDGDLLAANPRARVCAENEDESCRPEIAGEKADLSAYDTVIVGYPNWFLNAPKIIYTFLDSYDLTGKEVIPFCTSGGTPVTQSEEKLKGSYRNLNWGKGKQFSYTSTKQEVAEWLKKIQG